MMPLWRAELSVTARLLDRVRCGPHNGEPMKRPAVFFDRDNTLIVSDGYLGSAAQVVLVDGAASAVARARAMGFAVATISNQSGVARGLFDEAAVHAVNERLDQLLKARNPQATIDRHEFCPFHPEAPVAAYRQDSDLRKPKPGMIHQAAAALDLDLPRSWVVGDAPRDIEAGRAAGCRTILFRDLRLPASPAAEECSAVRPDFVVSSLGEALDVIEKNRGEEDADTETRGTRGHGERTCQRVSASPRPRVLSSPSLPNGDRSRFGAGGSDSAAGDGGADSSGASPAKRGRAAGFLAQRLAGQNRTGDRAGGAVPGIPVSRQSAECTVAAAAGGGAPDDRHHAAAYGTYAIASSILSGITGMVIGPDAGFRDNEAVQSRARRQRLCSHRRRRAGGRGSTDPPVANAQGRF